MNIRTKGRLLDEKRGLQTGGESDRVQATVQRRAISESRYIPFLAGAAAAARIMRLDE